MKRYLGCANGLVLSYDFKQNLLFPNIPVLVTFSFTSDKYEY
jgi:hypothetical protein